MGYFAYLIVAVALFSVGLVGALIRKEILRVFVAIEIMVAAANLALVALIVPHNVRGGEVAASGFVLLFFVWVASIANAAVGLSLFLLIRHKLRTQDTEKLKQLSG